MFLHNYFEHQVDTFPNCPAIYFREKSWTYIEVENRANQLAHYLRQLGAGPGKLVGILLDRSEQPIISILSALKSGAGYVPIDPAYPKERINHILETASIDMVLTESSIWRQTGLNQPLNTIFLDQQEEGLMNQPSDRITPNEICLKPEDVCYVIFTSGTTGKPKGVVIEHRNAVCFVEAFREVCQLNHQDRVYQGFSLGFDGSVEEIWMAFSSGASLVVAGSAICKIGTEVARLINDHEVTFFSTVPTLLSLIQDDLPSVRLLVVSGEVCPPELVMKWANENRRMLNVYGPTETTVNTTFEECCPGLPVTIGTPINNYETYILDENLQSVPSDECGELFIGGPAVARGYLNQPELSNKHFVTLNQSGFPATKRLYRTGDLVKTEKNGKLVFLGRLDTQVKIRGYRIEVAEIESVLREHPEIESAAVRVIDQEGIQHLAAFVVVFPDVKDLDRVSVLNLAKARLPDYMVPSHLDVIEKLPTLDSGKIARHLLPEHAAPLFNTMRSVVGPSNDLEENILHVFQDIFKIQSISVKDNFFNDLGGYSLLAAQVATRLREKLGHDVAIRDIYSHPTVRDLAEFLSEQLKVQPLTSEKKHSPKDSAKEVFFSVPRTTKWACYFLQGVSLLLFYGIYAATMTLYIIIGAKYLEGELSLASGMIAAVVAAPSIYLILLTLIVGSKWMIVGRFKSGEIPLWSFAYFRWWFVSRFQTFSGMSVFSGTPILNFYMRLMGAKIGKGVVLDSHLCTAFDLISVGDDSSIGHETQFLGYRVENGKLLLGEVLIGERCFVGIHSCLGLNTRMEDDSALGDLSLLPDGSTIAAGVHMQGSPTRKGHIALPKETEYKRHPIQYSIKHLISLFLLGIFLTIMGLPTAVLIFWAFAVGGVATGIVSLYLSVPLSIITFCLSVALIKQILLGRVEPGIYPIESPFYLKKWLIDGLMRLSIKTIRPVYTTLYLPPWLRLLGAQIGRRAEISTVSQISPELINIADESFFADGSIIGGRHFYRGYMEISRSQIGKRSFLGNSAILPIGSDIGDNCLLGCLSSPPECYKKTPDGTEWLGSPSFILPHRKKVAGFGDELTFNPTKCLYLQRLIIDALRILSPGIIGVTGLILLTLTVLFHLNHFGVLVTLLLSPFYGFVLAVFSMFSVAILKKMVMGTFQPVIKPLWSVYVWLNEMINGAYESVFAPSVLPLLGTPFLAPFLRTMGCSVGKGTFIETTLFSEFDLVQIGDYAAINKGAIIQNHLFEDRIMKSDYLQIGDSCNVGNMAVVLYSTQMNVGSTIGPLSLLMKGESLPKYSRWQGIPIESVISASS